MTETLRLAFVSASHPSEAAGGLAHTLAAICRPIAREGHEVTVYYPVRGPAPPPAEEWSGIRVEPVAWRRLARLPFGPDLEYSWRVAGRLGGALDAVIAHGEHGGAFAMRRARALRGRARSGPLALDAFHGVSLRFLEMGRTRRPPRWSSRLGYHADRTVLRWLEGEGARAADVCVPCSAAVGREVHELYGVPDSRIRVIYNGVDPQPTPTPAERGEAREALGVAEGTRALAFVGQDTYRKGLDVAIETVRRLRRAGRDVVLLNVGNEAPSSEGIRSFGVVDAATKRRVLVASDLFYLPTRYEGLPAVVQEAAALHLPVATTPAAHVEWGTPGKDFLLLYPNTPEAAAAQLAPLLDSADARRTMAEGGFRTLGSRPYGEQAREYLALVRELLAGAAG